MKLFVSRQCYWGVEDPLVVEIAEGGVDYSNPDMLSDPGGIYGPLGDMLETEDPREALEAAIAIRDEWNTHLEGEKCRIEAGFTGGFTMPFNEQPSDEDLRRWAEKAWEATPKCSMCGDPLPEEWYYIPGFDEKMCSGYCADEFEAKIYTVEEN